MTPKNVIQVHPQNKVRLDPCISGARQQLLVLHQHLVFFVYDGNSLFPALLFHLEKWWNAEKKGRGIRSRKRRERRWEGKGRESTYH